MNLQAGRAASQDETALIRAVARKDEAAVENLYRTHVDAVFRFVYRRVQERYEDAEEITQDTFLTALNLAPQFRGDASVLTWLCALARIRIIDFYRRHNREKRIPHDKMAAIEEAIEHAATTADPFQSLDEALLVDGLMAAVTEPEREALLLRYVEGLSLREIATQLGRTEKGVDGLIDRAKKKQRELIERWWGNHG
jgi:RNA polymerase sigma-70 factor (ECF subfamily)